RAKFKPVREAFMKDLAENHVAELRGAGVSEEDIANMAEGEVPEGYELHHKLPLEDGGTNATSNLVLIKIDPDHLVITNYQKKQARGMSGGQTRWLECPMPDSSVRFWPKTRGGGASPAVHKLELSTLDPRLRVWPKVPDRGAYFHRALIR